MAYSAPCKSSRATLYETPVTTILNQDVPVTREGVVACPGVTGGVLWSSPAYHPPTGLLITPAIDYCSHFSAADEVRFVPGQLYMGGSVRPEGDMSGWLTAVDAETGAERWRLPTPLPQVGAVTTTAGGLAIAGTMAGELLFVDVSSGELLHSIATGAPIAGGNVSYAVDGRQYIAVGTGTAMMTLQPPGAARARSASIIVYGLGAEGSAP